MTALPPIPRTPPEAPPLKLDLATLLIPVAVHVAIGFACCLLWNASLGAIGLPMLLWYQGICLWTLFFMAIIIPAVVIIRMLPAVRMVDLVKIPMTPPTTLSKEEETQSNDDTDQNPRI